MYQVARVVRTTYFISIYNKKKVRFFFFFLESLVVVVVVRPLLSHKTTHRSAADSSGVFQRNSYCVLYVVVCCTNVYSLQVVYRKKKFLNKANLTGNIVCRQVALGSFYMCAIWMDAMRWWCGDDDDDGTRY